MATFFAFLIPGALVVGLITVLMRGLDVSVVESEREPLLSDDPEQAKWRAFVQDRV